MTTPEQPPHDESLLLTWYAAGKLTDHEHRRVADHLSNCADCREELASVTQAREEIRRAFESEPGPRASVRRAVFAQLDPASSSNKRAGLFARVFEWLSVPAAPRWAPAAALLLALLPAGLLLRQAATPDDEVPAITTRSVTESPTRLLARFSPQATELQIRELLASLGARIVDGPSPDGGYVLELAPADPALLARKIGAARARVEILLSLELASP